MLGKEDYILILKHRHYAFTTASLLRKSALELSIIVGEVTEEEQRIVVKAAEYRTMFLDYNNEVLEQTLCQLGASKQSGDTKKTMIDKIIEKSTRMAPKIISLDPDQQSVVDNRNVPKLCINAGPGAGKTTTLTSVIYHILQDNPQHRILVLSYNRSAKDLLEERLVRLGIKTIKKNDVMANDWDGTAVLTFNEFGHQVSRSISADSKDSTGRYVKHEYVENDYKLELEKSLKKMDEINTDWDWLIIDEAQDLIKTHADIIDKLCEHISHLIVAGDPRQELYAGAFWFSELWLTEDPDMLKIILHYNHRSSKTVIKAINEFSRNNFPKLHHDQEMSTDSNHFTDGIFKIEYVYNYTDISQSTAANTSDTDVTDNTDNTDNTNEVKLRSQSESKIEMSKRTKSEILAMAGKLGGMHMTKFKPAEVYAIAPITIRRYDFDIVTANIKNTAYEYKPSSHIIELTSDVSGSNTTFENSYVIGTARKLKGTERKHSVIFGAATDYGANISRESIIKSLYVAISRARESILLLLDERVKETNPIACLVTLFGEADSVRKGIDMDAKRSYVSFSFIGAETLIGRCESIKATVAEQVDIDTKISPMIQELDIFDIYLKIRLAVRYGLVTLPSKYRLDHCTGRTKSGWKFDMDERQFVFRLDPLLYNYISTNSYFKSAGNGSREFDSVYKIVTAIKSVETSSCWHIIESVTEAVSDEELDKLSAILTTHGINTFGTTVTSTITMHRSEKTAGIVISNADFVNYETDFDSKTKFIDKIVTVSYVDYSRRLSGVVSNLCNVVSGTLINLERKNEKNTMETINSIDVNDSARVAIMFRYIQYIKNRFQPKDFIKLQSQDIIDCYIAVDIENIVIDGYSIITEIGAVCFSPGGIVRSTYHKIANGITKLTGDEGEFNFATTISMLGVTTQAANMIKMHEELTQLRILNLSRVRASSMSDSFRKWVDTVSSARIFLTWSGSDQKLLKLDGYGKTLDVYMLYVSWLELTCQARTSNRTLTDAAVHLFSESFPYAAHRAFEDATVTAGIFTTLVNFEGSL